MQGLFLYEFREFLPISRKSAKPQLAKTSISEKSDSQFAKISPCEITKKSTFLKINVSEKKRKYDIFFRYFDCHCSEGIDDMVKESVELQIVSSESIWEATKYVSGFGNERDTDDEK